MPPTLFTVIINSKKNNYLGILLAADPLLLISAKIKTTEGIITSKGKA